MISVSFFILQKHYHLPGRAAMATAYGMDGREVEVPAPVFLIISFEWRETESAWYVGHYLAYCTSPG
jgi:hypothetical protein